MNIYTINDLSNVKVIEILKKEFSQITDPDIISNYHPDRAHIPGNLFYILEQGRYRVGKYYVIADANDNFIASAGWNRYELDHTVALLLTRMYVSPQHRTKYYVGNHILPRVLEEVKEYQHAWVTWNNHNDTISKWFSRSLQGKRATMFTDWPEIYKKFKPIGKKTIYYTEQYVAEFDWKYND